MFKDSLLVTPVAFCWPNQVTWLVAEFVGQRPVFLCEGRRAWVGYCAPLSEIEETKGMLILVQRQVFSWSGRSCLFSVPRTFRIIFCKSQGDTNKHFRHESWNLCRRKSLHGFQLVIKIRESTSLVTDGPFSILGSLRIPRFSVGFSYIFIPNSRVAWRAKMWRLLVVPTCRWELS